MLRGLAGLAGVRLDSRLAHYRLRGDFRLGPDDVDAPLEVRAIVDADARALDVADQTSLFPNRNFFRHDDIAADAAEIATSPPLVVPRTFPFRPTLRKLRHFHFPSPSASH